MVTLSTRLASSIRARFRCVACWSRGFGDVGSTATDVGVDLGPQVPLGSPLGGGGVLGPPSRGADQLTDGVSVLLRGLTGGASAFRRGAISADRASARLVVAITADRAGARLLDATTADRAGARLGGAWLADGAGARPRECGCWTSDRAGARRLGATIGCPVAPAVLGWGIPLRAVAASCHLV